MATGPGRAARVTILSTVKPEPKVSFHAGVGEQLRDAVLRTVLESDEDVGEGRSLQG